MSVVIGTLVGMVEWSPPEPRELPAIRENLANQMRSPYEQQVLTELLQGGKGTLSPHTGDVSRDAAILLSEERDRLAAAELYYITADMSRLAHAAAETLPVDSSHPDDLPAPAGFMLFAEPLAVYAPDADPHSSGPITVVAASWGPNGVVSSDEGMWVTFWSANDLDAEAAELQQRGGLDWATARRRVRQLRAELSWDNEVVLHYGASNLGIVANDAPGGRLTHGEPLTPGGGWDQVAETTVAWAQIVRAAWLMMTQGGISTVEDEPLPRAMRRRAAREGRSPAPVRVVRIRDRAHAPQPREDEDSGARTYHVRWTVRGHWRRQWYPSRQEHRPVWINPHVKGPSDAPLYTSETVHLLDN